MQKPFCDALRQADWMIHCLQCYLVSAKCNYGCREKGTPQVILQTATRFQNFFSFHVSGLTDEIQSKEANLELRSNRVQHHITLVPYHRCMIKKVVSGMDFGDWLKKRCLVRQLYFLLDRQSEMSTPFLFLSCLYNSEIFQRPSPRVKKATCQSYQQKKKNSSTAECQCFAKKRTKPKLSQIRRDNTLF